jgi:F0F1-type ATP synthase assembly protein I
MRSRWIEVAAAVVGGALAGFGIGRVLGDSIVAGGTLVLIGFILLWWAFAEVRKADPAAPESEADGSHTVE